MISASLPHWMQTYVESSPTSIILCDNSNHLRYIFGDLQSPLDLDHQSSIALMVEKLMCLF